MISLSFAIAHFLGLLSVSKNASGKHMFPVIGTASHKDKRLVSIGKGVVLSRTAPIAVSRPPLKPTAHSRDAARHGLLGVNFNERVRLAVACA